MSTQVASARGATSRARILGASPWAIAVWASAALFAIVLSAEAIYEHRTLQTNFDAAVYDQRLWLLSTGRDPFSTVISRPFLADHFEPGLVLLTPLYWIGLGLPGVLAAQAIGLALTGPALYALARGVGATERHAALPALLWLACPMVATVALFDFRPATFAAVLLVLSVLAALQDRHVLLAVTTLLAFSLKEDIPLTYLVLGLLLIAFGKRRVGAILATASILAFVVASAVIEALGDQYEWQARRFAGSRGDTVVDAFGYMLRHPLETASDVLTQSGADVMLLVLATGGLALLAPAWMLLATPTALFNALSAFEPQHELKYHYHLLALTGLFVAAAVGVRRLADRGSRARLALSAGVTAALVVALVAGVVVHNPSPPWTEAERAEIERALARVPADAPVAATQVLLPQLSQRVHVYTLPEPFVPVDWGSPVTIEEMAERAAGVRYIALSGAPDDLVLPIVYDGSVADVRELLLREGFVPVDRAGDVEILERPVSR